LCDNGAGVPQDYAQAALWYRKAAEQGDAEAQWSLGGLYLGGHGVPRDYAEAYFWYALAAAGEQDASDSKQVAKYRDEAASHLTPADLTREQERTRKWFEAQSRHRRKRLFSNEIAGGEKRDGGLFASVRNHSEFRPAALKIKDGVCRISLGKKGLVRLHVARSVRRNHLDTVLAHLLIQRIRVVGFVTDQSFRQLMEEASGQNSFHKPALGRRSAFDRYGERKTITRGDSDDLGALAALGRTDGEAPFLALAKVASTNASSRCSLPRACRCLAST
jgi:hypothetical protein